MTELVRIDDRPRTFFDLAPREQVATAKEMAAALVEVIKERGLTRNFGGEKDHVEWEGWGVLLSFLGVRAEPAHVHRHPNGTWEAEVRLVRVADERIVGRGSAICSVEERNWAKAPDNSRRSMAITRAAGKAARLNFSWIMALGGLNVTPAEEMDHVALDTSAVFDGSDEHRKYVRDELQARGIAPAYWKSVLQNMQDRPLSERDLLIDQLTKTKD